MSVVWMEERLPLVQSTAHNQVRQSLPPFLIFRGATFFTYTIVKSKVTFESREKQVIWGKRGKAKPKNPPHPKQLVQRGTKTSRLRSDSDTLHLSLSLGPTLPLSLLHLGHYC